LVVTGSGVDGYGSRLDVAHVYRYDGTHWDVSINDIVPTWQIMLRHLCTDTEIVCEKVDISNDGHRLVVETNFGDVVEFQLRKKEKVVSLVLSNTSRVVLSVWYGKIAVVVLVALLALSLWLSLSTIQSLSKMRDQKTGQNDLLK
jgi:hypothetical protein